MMSQVHTWCSYFGISILYVFQQPKILSFYDHFGEYLQGKYVHLYICHHESNHIIWIQLLAKAICKFYLLKQLYISLFFFLFVNLVFKVVLHHKHVHSIIRSFFMLKIWWLHILHPRELHDAQRLKRQGAHLVKTFFSIFSKHLGSMNRKSNIVIIFVKNINIVALSNL